MVVPKVGLISGLVLMMSLLPLSGNKLPKHKHIQIERLTDDDVLSRAVAIAFAIVSERSCRDLIYVVAGQDPIAILAAGGFSVSSSPEIAVPNAAAVTTCNPPHVAFDRDYLLTFGPGYTAIVLVHELIHVAACPRWSENEMDRQMMEDMAMTITGYCARALEE